LRYHKDQGPLKYSPRRHNNLHLLCLEIVKLGDSNADAYSLAMEQLRNVKTVLEPVPAIRDDMGYLIEKRQLILLVRRLEINSILASKRNAGPIFFSTFKEEASGSP
jgi:hypothetical protein